ncbi:MAG: TIR domain-containing protein [Promethearchaeota archaeon]
MHKVFISYHHKNDQSYKEKLLDVNKNNNIFINVSVDTGDIDENLPDDYIRELIRDYYLRDSTITILLVGTESKWRKHIDWELYSSMFDGRENKKSGILVINLPTVNCNYFTASHEKEKELLYPGTNWISIDNRNIYEERYPYMPDRIIDNLLEPEAKISVVNWNGIIDRPNLFSILLDETHNDRSICKYDMSRKMRRANS